MTSPDRSVHTQQRAVPLARGVFRGRIAAYLTLLAGIWLVLSIFLLAYPFTIDGVDAKWRDGALGVIVGVLAVARIRVPGQTWVAGTGIIVAGLALVAMPFVLGYGPQGQLAVAWWNELLTGAVVLATGVIGLAQTARARRQRPIS